MNNETIRKLQHMRLPAFAAAYQDQLTKSAEYEAMTFSERLSLLVDVEFDTRHNNNIKRLIKNAKLTNSSAFLGNIEYLPDRHLNRETLESLASNEYIQQSLNVIMVGATGCGKTYISNALGVNACQAGYKARYIRSPELFCGFQAARLQNTYLAVLKQYQKYALMIIDEFLLVSATEQEQRDLLELMEYRCGCSATIFCSQFSIESWHERLGGNALADAILDRIIPSAYTLRIGGDVSMRQRHSRQIQ